LHYVHILPPTLLNIRCERCSCTQSFLHAAFVCLPERGLLKILSVVV
jgi:hypothetical protein